MMVKEKKLNHFLKKKGECEGHEIEAVCEVVPILAYFFRWCCLIWRSKKITCHFSASPPQRFRPRSATGCKQQIIALSKVCNVNNTNFLEQKIVVFSLVATTHLQP
jgi:hypothetical protein